MLKDILENFKNTLVIVNLCLLLTLILVKRRGFLMQRDVVEIETTTERLRRDMEELDIELSYLRSPERLRAMCLDMDSPRGHIMSRNEIRILDELIPFYNLQYEKTAGLFILR